MYVILIAILLLTSLYPICYRHEVPCVTCLATVSTCHVCGLQYPVTDEIWYKGIRQMGSIRQILDVFHSENYTPTIHIQGIR